jgi:chorismate dehydratase
MFFNGESDLALIPVGGLMDRSNYEVCTDFCIGCDGTVRTVGVFSKVPTEQIDTIYLDSDSRTSVLLVKVIFETMGKKDIVWKEGIENYFKDEQPNSGFLAIGDKVFDYEPQFPYFFDLGGAWKKWFGLPFAFAVFVKNPSVDQKVIDELNLILASGIENISTLTLSQHTSIKEIKQYFTDNISYHLDDKKKLSMKIFEERVGNLRL